MGSVTGSLKKPLKMTGHEFYVRQAYFFLDLFSCVSEVMNMPSAFPGLVGQPGQ
jgi:hypothetical protein